MLRPLQKGNDTLHPDGETMAQVRSVTGDPREELRDKVRVVELVFFLGAQVGLRTAHPEKIAVDDELAIFERTHVTGRQSFQSEGKKAINTGVHKGPARLGLSIQEMRESPVRLHVFTPHDGVTQKNNIRCHATMVMRTSANF